MNIDHQESLEAEVERLRERATELAEHVTDLEEHVERLEGALDQAHTDYDATKDERDAAEARATELERKLAKGWDEVVAADKARAIKAEIRAEAAEARATELERERDAQKYRADEHVKKWVESDAGKAEERVERAETALQDLLLDMGVDDIDPRLDYVVAQITRTVLADARAALGETAP